MQSVNYMDKETQKLFEELVAQYDLENLRTLSYLLDIPPDEIGLTKKTPFVRDLIDHCQRHGKYDQLAHLHETKAAFLLGPSHPSKEEKERVSVYIKKGRFLLNCTFYVAVAFVIIIISSFFITQIRLMLVKPTQTPTPTLTISPTIHPSIEPEPIETPVLEREPTGESEQFPTEEAGTGLTRSESNQQIIGCMVTPRSGWVEYSVIGGDTIQSLAELYDVPIAAITESNCLYLDAILEDGQVLWLPPCAIIPPIDWRIYSVQTGDTLWSLAEGLGTTTNTITNVNCLTSTTLKVDQEIWVPNIINGTPTPQP